MSDLRNEKNIIDSWDYKDKVYVSIICPTFNQEEYIRSALDGFLTQLCDYKFEIVVHDDCSTDQTTNILNNYKERYPNIIKLILQDENQHSQGRKIIPIALEHCEGEYIAFCDGDDYWFDRRKLQKQILALEKNNKYTLSYSKAKAISPNGKVYSIFGSGLISNLNYIKNGIPTLTVLIRRSVCVSFFEKFKSELNSWKMSDYPLWLYAKDFGQFHYIGEVTANYRVFDTSVSRPSDPIKVLNYRMSAFNISRFFIKSSCQNIVNKCYLILLLNLYAAVWNIKYKLSKVK
ncbi:glycosyltransferase [Vibrio satsumensis]|uniref:glycosyltransferase n=1 Tax=Vibrio satsumensis TaxID=2910245 RepID=UPI003D107601